MNFYLKNKENSRIQYLNSVVIPNDPNITSVKIDTSVGDKYFADTYRFGDGFVGLVSDIEVAKDPKTPSILKEHIQHIGAHAVHVSQDMSSLLDDSDQVLDGIVPRSLQTAHELKSYIDNNND